MLSLDKLSASLPGGFRLQEVSFTVGAGERLAVLGPNGSGKSFLLRLILGLVTPESGQIRWGEEVLSQARRVVVPPEARAMGVVFQEGALFPHLSVRANVDLALPRGLERDARTKKVSRALEIARVGHLDHRPVQALSGGEQQRVALARALAHRPRLLLLDEPFHSLDGPLKREILADVRALVSTETIATILVTHDTDEAASFADRVVLLRQGKVAQEGTFEELYERPLGQETAAFLGPVEGLEAAQARAAGIALPGPMGEASLYFRPEHLELRPADQEGEGLEVVSVGRRGTFQDVEVRLPDGLILLSRALSGSPLQPGQWVAARLTQTLFDPSREEREE